MKGSIHVRKSGGREFHISNSSYLSQFTTETPPAVISASAEISRSLLNIEADEYQFVLEHQIVGEKKIPVFLLIPDAPQQKLPLVLFIHGFEASKEKSLRYGVHFAAKGYLTVMMDLPEHGERAKPDFQEKYSLELHPRRAWMNRLFLIKESFEEIRLLTNHFLSDERIDPSRLGVSGISMGGTLALLAAYYEPKVKAAATFLSILDFEGMDFFNKMKPFSEEELKSARMLDPAAVYQRMPNAAILTQYGEADLVAGKAGQARFDAVMKGIYEHSPGRYQTVGHPGISHDVSLDMVRRALEWFKKYL